MTFILPDKAIIFALHKRQMDRHGGGLGLRDEGLLESAIARPHQKLAYVEDREVTIFELAGTLAYGLSQNQAFVDGNKRVAFVAAFTTLRVNGVFLDASEREAEETFLKLADGKMTEAELTKWLEEKSTAGDNIVSTPTAKTPGKE